MALRARDGNCAKGSLYGTFVFRRILFWILIVQLPLGIIGKTALTPAEAEQQQRENQRKREQIRDKTKDFVNQYSGQFTYEQLKAWFEAQNPGSSYFDASPRLFSVCVTPEFAEFHEETRHIKHYEKMLEQMFTDPRPFYEFDLDRDSIRKEHSGIKSLTLNRINSAEPDMVNMRQWMHLTIETGRPLEGIYMQSVIGPLGLPFGEFSVDFPCKDDTSSVDIDVVGQITYCAFRAHAAVVHPAVYVAKSDSSREKFHAHFRWSDITCMETPYMQFIIIAVEEFVAEPQVDVHYKPLLTSVYINLDFDSKDGAPYPYYPDWRNEMHCYIGSEAEWEQTPTGMISKTRNKVGADHKFTPLKWNVSDTVFRVQPNEDFDACVRSVVIKDELMRKERLLCPPGPFQCDESYSDKVGADGNTSNVTLGREDLLIKETATSGCFPCGAPRCLDSDFHIDDCDVSNKTHEDRRVGSSFIDNVETYSAGRSHGIIAMLASLVLVPVANFMARFFKEIYQDFFMGNGPWIFVHAGAHIGNLLLLWLSIASVGPPLAEYATIFEQCQILLKNDTEAAKRCAWEKSLANPHVSLGMVVFILQHLLVIFGWWRMPNTFFRGIQVIIHTHVGYFTQVLADSMFLTGVSAIVAVLNNPCFDIVAFNVLLVTAPFLFAGIGVALDCMTDTKVGILPRRKQWPVLEPVSLQGKRPFGRLKWIILGCYSGIMGLLWILTLGSYVSQNENSVSDIDAYNKDLSTEALRSIKRKSLFGECEGDFIPGT